MDELRSPSRPTSPAAPVIVLPSPSMLSVLQLLGTIRCPKKPRAAHKYDSMTRLQLEAKEAMRRRGVPSPDEWDAVALTFAEPVVEASYQALKPRALNWVV